jgi:hypothetical protein
MAVTLSAAVGSAPAANQFEDVNKVVALLNAIPDNQGGAHGSLAIFMPGLSGSLTEITQAIVNFQNFNFGKADGRVDPGGKTIQLLNARSNGGANPPLPPKPKPQGVTLDGSVGRAPAGNKAVDLMKVTRLLRAIPTEQGGPTEDMGDIEAALVLNNSMGPLIQAITRFQNFNFGTADGRVDRSGKTLQLLNAKTNGGTKPPVKPTPAPKQPKTISRAVGRPPAANLPLDQDIVIGLLNKVPLAEGGPGQPVSIIIPGIGDGGLIKAIENFQRKQFNGFSDGRVDPGGVTLARLNQKSKG